MRVVNGTKIRPMAAAAVAAWAAPHAAITADLGTGDGRFVRRLAARNPGHGAIGVDLCAANLRDASRAAPPNALFVVADALALPPELAAVADRITIDVPWGSLLRGLLAGDPGLLAGLVALGRGDAALAIVVNADALAKADWDLDAGTARIAAALEDAGIVVHGCRRLDPDDLRRHPTTWAKRLAFGRDPRAARIDALLGCT